MSGSIVIALEGILRADAGNKISEGVLLYDSLIGNARTVLVLDGLDVPDAQQWLSIQGLKGHAELVTSDARYQGSELRRHQLERLRARGEVTLLVDPNPANVTEALKLGISSMLFTQPRYARPEFRPDADKSIRPWSQIMAEQRRQDELKAKDSRLTDPVVVILD